MSLESNFRSATRFAEAADQAAAATHRRVVLEARERGASLVLSRDGKVVHVPASEIVLPGEESSTDKSAIEQATPTDNTCSNGSETASDK